MTLTIEPTYQVNIHCPLCELSFSSTKVRSSHIRVTTRDADFCTHFVDETINPHLYYVSVCHYCGYASSRHFSTTFHEKAVQIIYQSISTQWKGKNYSGVRTTTEAIETYKLAIYCGIIKKEKQYALAGLYMRLAWLYRKGQDEQNEHRFLSLALQAYQSSYTNCDFEHSTMSEPLILYMIGELHLRLENIPDAIRTFSKVVSHPSKKMEPMIVEKARDQWQFVRQQQKKQ
ncbi:DUF2225 domain-containing protein [Priestia taiwanensis]|uniref:DUF2225 domain-containing protein n=1 Tax=Priestia taiwanensis TaxID=1347902 RepID=UPI00166B5CAA|nr:DUF2225 domain-containing protein [Priestia taiwanensis]MBM7364563.1 uncharacterized protein (DUF2225 family) [Priestia taiwanensis]